MCAVGWGVWGYGALAYKYNQMGWGFVQALYSRHEVLWKKWAWKKWLGLGDTPFGAAAAGPSRRGNPGRLEAISGRPTKGGRHEQVVTQGCCTPDEKAKGDVPQLINETQVSPDGEARGTGQGKSAVNRVQKGLFLDAVAIASKGEGIEKERGGGGKRQQRGMSPNDPKGAQGGGGGASRRNMGSSKRGGSRGASNRRKGKAKGSVTARGPAPSGQKDVIISLNIRGYASHKMEEMGAGGLCKLVTRPGAHSNIRQMIDAEEAKGNRAVMVFLQETWLLKTESPLQLTGSPPIRNHSDS
jgi:hypothetical protein